MTDSQNPTKPVSNDEKFKPQNVADPLKDQAPTDESRGKPGDTAGYDVSRGSDGQTKATPSA